MYNKVEKVYSLLKDNNPFLRFGLELEDGIGVHKSNLSKDSYSLVFQGRHDIEVQVFFRPSKKVFMGHFNVFIGRKSDGEDFMLKDFLKYERGGHDDILFVLSAYEGSFEEKVMGFISFLDKLTFIPKLELIIRGDLWEDYPFDWMGMK